MTHIEKEETGYKKFYTNPQLKKRNLGLALSLVGLFTLFYVISIIKLL